MELLLTYYFLSLGCPKNEVDSQALKGILTEEGFEETLEPEKAKIIIINTCGFIEDAKIESIDAILEASAYKAKLIVVGCLSQRYGEELLQLLPEIDVLLGVGISEEFRQMLQLLKDDTLPEPYLKCQKPFANVDYNYLHRPSTLKHYRYLKIAEGCSNHCSYCIIPELRGPYRSRPIEDLLAEAELLCQEGAQEIILIAQDTSCYGVDLYGERSLHKLLEELVKIKDLSWLRIMYTQPAGITDELLEVMQRENKICKYLDLPLQHIRARLLKSMNRWGNRELIEKLLAKIRHSMPDVTLRTTFIVGYPGETEEDFAELVDFVQQAKFDRAGAFIFSPEEGTPAYSFLEQIDEKTKEERYLQLNTILRQETMLANQRYLGETVEVIIDSLEDTIAWGRTRGDAPDIDGVVIIEGLADLAIGEIYPVEIELALEQELVGEVHNEFA